MRAEQTSMEKGWSRRTFWMILGIVFALQVAWLFLFGRPSPAPLDDVAHRTSFRMLAGSLPSGAFDSLLVSDPTLFVVPSSSSFSGPAWMNIKEMNYSPTEWTEPPRWLTLRPETLMTAFSQYVQANRRPISHVSEKKAPYEPAPTERPVTILPPSRMRIEGAVAGRFVSEYPALSSWQNIEPLDRSVVQVGVNESGQVVTLRLLQRSGSAAADQAALKTAGSLQFAPSTGTSLMLGEVNFLWQTEPLPTTNSTSIPATPVVIDPR